MAGQGTSLLPQHEESENPLVPRGPGCFKWSHQRGKLPFGRPAEGLVSDPKISPSRTTGLCATQSHNATSAFCSDMRADGVDEAGDRWPIIAPVGQSQQTENFNSWIDDLDSTGNGLFEELGVGLASRCQNTTLL